MSDAQRGPASAGPRMEHQRYTVPNALSEREWKLRSLEKLPTPAQRATVTLWCGLGKHNWERTSQRGRRPFGCPECTAKHEAELASNKSPETPDTRDARLVLAREKKAQIARERALRAGREREEQRSRIEAQLPNISERWNRAFAVAMRENTAEAWRHCDSLMTGYVNTKRALTK